ncbi:MAG: aldo/keto reductase, partial [Pseudomonadota bacterium]
VAAAVGAGVGWFDTAPFYGHGIAEHRFGHGLRNLPRDSFALSTKVGRLLRPCRPDAVGPSPFQGALQFRVEHDYTYDATMRSIEDSYQRLGMSRIDIVLIHDVDVMHQASAYDARFEEAVNGACRALSELRSAGVIGAYGLGVNEVGPCARFGEAVDLDCVMLARSYTLLGTEGVPDLLSLAAEKGFSVLVAGPFASGILAGDDGTFNYAAPDDAVRTRVARLREVCNGHGVSLKAAALQFPLASPQVAAVATGAVTAAQVEENAALVAEPIPGALWQDLAAAGLIDAALAPGGTAAAAPSGSGA